MRYLERTSLTGCFVSQADALRWKAEKEQAGFTVAAPFNHPCPWTNEFPWECVARQDLGVEEVR